MLTRKARQLKPLQGSSTYKTWSLVLGGGVFVSAWHSWQQATLHSCRALVKCVKYLFSFQGNIELAPELRLELKQLNQRNFFFFFYENPLALGSVHEKFHTVPKCTTPSKCTSMSHWCGPDFSQTWRCSESSSSCAEVNDLNRDWRAPTNQNQHLISAKPSWPLGRSSGLMLMTSFCPPHDEQTGTAHLLPDGA